MRRSAAASPWLPDMIRVKRVYEAHEKADGRRFLVERLWPRGVRKEALADAEWLKDVAPSAALRIWYAHRVERCPAASPKAAPNRSTSRPLTAMPASRLTC